MELKKLKELWEQFGDVPINDNDEIDISFLDFEKGTDKLHIWHWFEEQNKDFIVGEMVNI